MKKIYLILASLMLVSAAKGKIININIAGLEDQDLTAEIVREDGTHVLKLIFEPKNFTTFNVEITEDYEQMTLKEGVENHLFYIPAPEDASLENTCITKDENYLKIIFPDQEDNEKFSDDETETENEA